MVVVDAQIKLPRKFQVDPTTQTHFLSDLFFLIAIRPAMVLKHHTKIPYGWGCLINLIFGMVVVVVVAQIKLPRNFQVDLTTQTHFLSDLFFLIAIHPVVGI